MSLERLLSLQEENDRAGAEMLIESERFDRIKKEKPRAVSSFNLFKTPVEVAEKMVSMIPDNLNHPKILEPSAGLGNLYRAIFSRFHTSAEYTLIENSPACMEELYRQNIDARLLQRDFFEVSYKETGLFDLIVMNPPFKNGVDIKHINHAIKFLEPEGLIISLCANGPRQNKRLKPIVNKWYVLPAGSFKSEGTMVEVVLLTMNGNAKLLTV